MSDTAAKQAPEYSPGYILKGFVNRTFPGLRLQTSIHGRDRGSLQVFDADDHLILDIDTKILSYDDYHRINLARLGRLIRNKLPEDET